MTKEESRVVIIGAGVSGLALATFLRASGVPCVVLERRERARIEERQRAGVVDARGVRMFERRGLADKLLAGPVAQTIEYRINGRARVFEVTADGGSDGRFCTQQMLVTNLLRELVDVSGGDVRFAASDVQIHNEGVDRPSVTYSDASGVREIACDWIVGCDGNRGVSRASIPPGVLTRYSHEFGHAWLAVLVEAPLVGHPIMGVSDHGCVCQLPRGPYRSRYYLQCALGENAEDWSDERVWYELRKRLCVPELPAARIIDRLVVQLRSVVYAPMRHRALFLAGDAAHLVPPTSAKGANLALHDVDVLADALRDAALAGDHSALDAYSDERLATIWNYQDFAVSMTDMMHDAGDPALQGTFRQQIARARLDNLFRSPTAARLHSEYQRGTN